MLLLKAMQVETQFVIYLVYPYNKCQTPDSTARSGTHFEKPKISFA